MSHPTTTTTAPGAIGPRVGHEGTYADQPKHHHTTAVSGTTTTRSGHHDEHVRERTGCQKFGLVILCFILPPLAVGIDDGCSFNLMLNIIFLILGWIPAIIHALCVVTF